jgi:NAD(P)-dependent dehydrogenase (short-subunit alcohol dehydrogenase family)
VLLEGKCAVVYGAGGAVGAAVAKSFAAEGAHVALAGRGMERLEQVMAEIVRDGGRAEVAAVDAHDERDVADHLQRHLADTDRLDVSFNAVGLGYVIGEPLIEATVDAFATSVQAAMRLVTLGELGPSVEFRQVTYSPADMQTAAKANGRPYSRRVGPTMGGRLVMRGAFSGEQRDRVRDHILEMASADQRVVAGAVVGSFARGSDDRWSDLDLTFAIPDDVPVDGVLDDWSRELTGKFHAVHLFDLPSRASIFRVFLLPGWLQVDVAFTPASQFESGPGFKLLFGDAVRPDDAASVPSLSGRRLFGLAVHHAVRARICIERGRYWQA